MQDEWDIGKRILVIDDTESIHQDFYSVLANCNADTTTLNEAEEALLGNVSIKPSTKISYELDSAFQGQEGLARVEQAVREKRPYQLAFVDMRMPPGWDGLQTIEAIWQVDPKIQIVICTAYADYSWDEILSCLGHSDGLLVLKKPFDNIEVQQMTHALTRKWVLNYQASAKVTQLEQIAAERTQEFERTNHELKQTQCQVIQNEKLAAIGQLAAGVAHEINTPVGFVASNFQTLRRYMNKFMALFAMYENLAQTVNEGDRESRFECIHEINKLREKLKIKYIMDDLEELFSESQEGLARVTDIVQNLRDFSRVDQSYECAEYDFNEGIKTTLVVARNELKYDVDIKLELSDLPVVSCHSGQLNQVLLNMLVNAAQAIKSQERGENGIVKIRTYATETYVVCEIADDGPGIPPDVLPKVFDPFFTTKAPGKGTGLGLSVSYDIVVNKNKGELFVDSRLGEGTTFSIKLPREAGHACDQEVASHETENSAVCR